ncbi:hypothetical protein [Hymenobacter cavernae]|uniref:DUF3822 family protein n=1 Tax=Hymenobacter cavernae TaxID=2044852 RepID=A0ABQ1UW08_9BACT|nr:hypothetical protein [Hymenobacter cavernae]GGF27998.1 hypothetical protein GCM10011383_44670 [Hymenobacter cavernae]
MATPASPLVPFDTPLPFSADFLAAHQIIFCHQTEDYCLFVERNEAGRVRAYVFAPCDGFYLVEQHRLSSTETEQLLPALQQRVHLQWQQSTGLPSWRPILLPEPGAEADDMSEEWLMQVAYQAIAYPWPPKGAPECFQEVVSLAFLGHSNTYDGVYTPDGLQLWLQENTAKSWRTLQQHLQWLQEERLLVVHPTPEAQRVTVQFQQQALAPALDLAVLPTFFQTLFYE